MPTAPYAKARVSVNGGGWLTGFQTAINGGSTIDLSGESTSGWVAALWQLFGYPRGLATPAGWSIDGSGVIYYLGTTPPQITLPKSTTTFGRFLVRLTVNNGVKNGVAGHPDVVDETAGWEVLSPNLGLPEIAAGEQTQVDALRGWTDALQRLVHALESGALPGQGYKAIKSTGNTRQILQTYTIPTNSAVVMEMYALAKKIGAVDSAFFAYRHVFYRAGAGPVAIGALEDLGSRPNGTTWTADIANASGNDITSGVTGQAATDIEWQTITKTLVITDTSV